MYENGWLKIAGQSPDFVLVRSWNDFAHATEIAPSRQFGYQYLDSTKLSVLRLANQRGFGVRILSHTLPPVLRPGQLYPVDLLVKNGGMAKMVSSAGFRVDYRIMHNGEKIAGGTATETIALFDLSTTHLNFPLLTGFDQRHPFAEGAYELYLDFRRNKIPFMNLHLMTETVGTLQHSLHRQQSGRRRAAHQQQDRHRPARRRHLPLTVQLRNLGDAAWRKSTTRFHLRWADAEAHRSITGMYCR